MSTRLIKLSGSLTVGLITIALVQGQANQGADNFKSGLSIEEVKNYRMMVRVNQKPIDMVEATKYMCAPPSALIHGPHYNPGIVYYVNEIASRGMKSFSADKLFPAGSIIVKEKQERKTEESVHIITVMKKVRSGPGEDSWEYKMYDTRTWSEIDSSKRSSGSSGRTCIECHRQYKENDYISGKGIELLRKL